MGKKDNSPSISFFSFQDIITSVTGIMFLVVIMLVLLILNTTPAASQKTQEQTEELRALKKEIAELKKMLSSQTSDAERLRKLVKELESLKAEELPSRLRKIKEELQKKQLHLQSMESEAVELRDKEKSFTAAILKSKELAAAQKEKEKDALEKLKHSREKLERLKRLLAGNKKLIRFVWNKASSNEPRFVICSDKEIQVVGLDHKLLTSYKGASGGKVDWRQFVQWAEKEPDPRAYYYVLMLKPSAFSYADALSEALGAKKIERGREVLPDENFEIMIGGGGAK